MQWIPGKLAVLLLLLQSTVAFSDPIVDASGQLLGASNVEVNSMLFDVVFVDGTCIDVFDGCDDASDFSFTLQSDAIAAADALLAMVFLDSASGLFDSMPDLTAGCEVTFLCAVLTPFDLTGTGFVRQTVAFNDPGDFDSVIEDDQQAITDDLGSDTGAGPLLTWAVWTPSPVSVPEPGTAALLMLGLLGIGLLRRTS